MHVLLKCLLGETRVNYTYIRVLLECAYFPFLIASNGSPIQSLVHTNS